MPGDCISERSRLIACALHLFALSGFALTQPLFRLLERYPAFLIAHHATAADLALLTFILLTAAALCLWFVEILAAVISPRLQARFHLLFVAFLVALIAMPALRRLPKVPGALLVLLGLTVGALLSWAYARWDRLRSFMTFLALAPVLFAVSFAFSPDIFKLWGAATEPKTLGGTKEASHPIVMVVFDDLAVISLMDERMRIDPIRYPSFAALAKDATWFRNATTVGERTRQAVPAILTGRYPQRLSRQPTAVDYPRNLFTLLQSAYRMNIHEPVTALYPGNRDSAADYSQERLENLYSDLSVLYLHLILPNDLRAGLPSLEEKWSHFTDPGQAKKSGRSTDRRENFYAFLESITPCERGCFHFLHTLIPHPPWQYLPSGRKYEPDVVFGQNSSRWGGEEWWLAQAYQRHLLQVALADRLLGELIERLKSLGMYDRSLIVVTSDHGRNFWPHEKARDFSARHAEGILGIPLLIKKPYQREAIVSDRNVETIDILPTIMELLGVGTAWPLDGCSAVSPACPERARKIAVRGKKRIEFDADVVLRGESLKRKIALFGTGTKTGGLFAIGSYPQLLGRDPVAIGIGGVAESITLSLSTPAVAARGDDYLPARVTAVLHSRDRVTETPQIAISVNGAIQAVAPALPADNSKLVVSAMIPEEAVSGSRRDFQFFIVKGTPAKPALFKVPVS